jgi:hypothetical protein
MARGVALVKGRCEGVFDCVLSCLEQSPNNLHVVDSGLLILSSALRQVLRWTSRTVENPSEEVFTIPIPN